MYKRLLNALPAGIALVQNARTPHNSENLDHYLDDFFFCRKGQFK
jgi:hypothetical protein